MNIVLRAMQNIACSILILGLYLSVCVHGETVIEEIIVEPVVGRFVHAEGPHWDHRSQKLYFVDIEKQKICKFDPATKHVACTFIRNGPVGFVVPVEGEPHKFVAGSGNDLVLVTWNGHSNTTNSHPKRLAVVDLDRSGTRWNDGKADSSGRLWGGTIGTEVNNVVVADQASLYKIDSSLKPVKEVSPVTNSNGLAWNLKDRTFYYIDTPTLQVAAFDFEPINGTISNRRVAFDLSKNNVSGLPDGMTIDTDGNLWVALYGGSGVINVNPCTGKVIRFIELPVKSVTSCTFGGPLLDELYVTTSSRDVTSEELDQQPYAGYVFTIKNLGTHGSPANSFQLS